MNEDGSEVRVHITNPEDLTVVRTEEKEPEHFIFSTFVVAAGLTGYNVVEMILPEDPLRKDASILACDSPVVVCHSMSQASQVANQVAGVPYPQGAYLPAGFSVTISGTARVYVTATAGTASRVSVVTNRRGRE
jgi:hypothetical protein